MTASHERWNSGKKKACLYDGVHVLDVEEPPLPMEDLVERLSINIVFSFIIHHTLH